jgi:hypothetical protein
MPKAIKLEKLIWTESDFAKMGWLDSQIWSMYADDLAAEFVLDLDYILKWQDPAPGETNYKFWISTATMVFENVNGVAIQMNSSEGAIEVANLYMENSATAPNLHQFRFECAQGELRVQASGFKMYIRKLPVLQQYQNFSYAERGGINFAREPGPKGDF